VPPSGSSRSMCCQSGAGATSTPSGARVVHELLDGIVSEFAKSTADACLRTIIGPLLRWHADCDEDFVLLLGKNMRRDKRTSSDKAGIGCSLIMKSEHCGRCTDDGNACSGMPRLETGEPRLTPWDSVSLNSAARRQSE
jgi:hypothetical protein